MITDLSEFTGDLTIKDVTRNISLPFEFLSPVSHPFEKKKKVAGFKTRFKIDRLDYHVGSGKFLDMGVVGKEVDIDIEMEALADK